MFSLNWQPEEVYHPRWIRIHNTSTWKEIQFRFNELKNRNLGLHSEVESLHFVQWCGLFFFLWWLMSFVWPGWFKAETRKLLLSPVLFNLHFDQQFTCVGSWLLHPSGEMQGRKAEPNTLRKKMHLAFRLMSSKTSSVLDTSSVVMTKHWQKYTATKNQRYRSENKADDAERITIHQILECVRVCVCLLCQRHCLSTS